MEAKRKHIIYKEESRRQAVEMVIHSGKTQAQVARALGCSEYSLNFWKKAYLRQPAPVLNHPFLNVGLLLRPLGLAGLLCR